MSVTSQWDAYCADMMIAAPSITPQDACSGVRDTLTAHPEWPGLAVCQSDGQVLGYISRHRLLQLLSKPLMADLYSRRPIELLMDHDPLRVDGKLTLDQVCAHISQERPEALAEGFIITENGLYRGLGSIATTLAATVRQARHRTDCIAREKDEVERALRQLRDAHAELNRTHAELNRVNRHIQESISYASRIQSSLLPSRHRVQGLLHDIAVGWTPRDVVGGDFYWIGRFGGRCLLAVMDCTGHGVPGAFMTAIVASVLDRILHEHCHDDPARILELLNRLVKDTLHRELGETAVFDAFAPDDGLDAAICLVDMEHRGLIYAGANIPLLYAVDGQLREIRGDRQSLGYRSSRPDFNFTNHTLSLTPGMSFYLATDGVTDQVGGPHRRLFGRRRLLEALRAGLGLSMERQLELILATLAAYRGQESPRDDMTFVGFAPLPPPNEAGNAAGDEEGETVLRA